MNMAFTEDDIWLLSSTIENLRGGSQNEERRVEAAWRLASKLDDLMRRLAVEIPEVAPHFSDSPSQPQKGE